MSIYGNNCLITSILLPPGPETEHLRRQLYTTSVTPYAGMYFAFITVQPATRILDVANSHSRNGLNGRSSNGLRSFPRLRMRTSKGSI